MLTFKGSGYSVEIGSLLKSSFSSLLDQYEKQNIIVIVDENTHDSCLTFLTTNFPELENAEIILLPCGEENKVMEICFQVWNAFTEHGFGRSDLVINLGGGVVMDMGGFIASIYKRGMTFINIPTSLMGMVDAAIGGKTGIDLNQYKNQLGTFAQPKYVYIDTSFLKTLPAEEIFNGYAEMLKHALIRDVEFWNKIKTIHSEDELTTDEIIFHSIKIKASIIEEDPREGGLRKLLNFGHTVGHALESYYMNKTAISHGHAIALGMCTEAHISMKQNRLSDLEYKEIEKTLTKIFPMISLAPDDIQNVIELMYQDKKNDKGNIRCVLLNGIGFAAYDIILTEKEIAMSLLHLSLLSKISN
ncbi:MAG: 3-dehydroquinate synthase [Bacteroidetes bacterium]|nr:3-dehydroquinate synthase [Bacteroidota bacterium]